MKHWKKFIPKIKLLIAKIMKLGDIVFKNVKVLLDLFFRFINIDQFIIIIIFKVYGQISCVTVAEANNFTICRNTNSLKKALKELLLKCSKDIVCQNGGVCENLKENRSIIGYKCKCKTGFSGSFCERGILMILYFYF